MCVEDSKWLEPGVRILKELLPTNGKGSISQQFRALHNGQANIKMQTSEFTSEDRTSPSGNSFWLSYRQIFLFSLRHFPVMDGQALRKDVAKQSSPHPEIQHRWWHELSFLASESGYRELRRKYQDRRAADAKAIENCVCCILPSKYYQIDSARMHRIVQLNCQLMSDIPHVDKTRSIPELTSDHDGCESDISDRCGRPYDQYFHANQESLFLDYIYSSSYSQVLKRYLTTFAVKQDFFHSFFGQEEDDLDQGPHATVLRVKFAKDEGGNEDEDDVIRDSHCVTSNEVMNTEIVNRSDENFPMADHHFLTSGDQTKTKNENECQLQPSKPRPPMFIFSKPNKSDVISFEEASRLLSRTRKKRRKR